MHIACVKPEDDSACSVATKPGGTCQRFGSLMLYMPPSIDLLIFEEPDIGRIEG
jgi:hypothetical protein